MYISKDIQSYSETVTKIAYAKYKKEMEMHSGIFLKSYEVYRTFLNQELNHISGFVYLEEGECLGYILYHTWEENGDIFCRVPEWGYGVCAQNREKVISRLFQTLAEELAGEKLVHFSMNVYAHDQEIQRLFSFLEFGIQAEVGIYRIEEVKAVEETCVRKISKDELEDKWDEIWRLLKQLIDHLKKSPVFYRGEEFTEEVYREFFADAGTNVYIAENQGSIIGLIEANEDTIAPIFEKGEAANVGEAYVLSEYRGTALSQELLYSACKDMAECGCRFAWVEHGTANPNARYFWNKYFQTYRYEMIRTINSI